MAVRIEDELERCRVRLFGYALSLTGDHGDADDLLQECAVRALAAASVPDSRPASRAWLFRIMRNAWIDQHRRRGFIVTVQLDESRYEEAMSWSGERSLIDAITVKQALARISSEHREVVALVDLVGFAYAEAADILDLPIGTVMSRLARARRALLNQIDRPQLANDDAHDEAKIFVGTAQRLRGR